MKSSSIKSSVTSAKYSWPRQEQKLEIQDSGVPEEVDMVGEAVRWVDRAKIVGSLVMCKPPKQADRRSSTWVDSVTTGTRRLRRVIWTVYNDRSQIGPIVGTRQTNVYLGNRNMIELSGVRSGPAWIWM